MNNLTHKHKTRHRTRLAVTKSSIVVDEMFPEGINSYMDVDGV